MSTPSAPVPIAVPNSEDLPRFPLSPVPETPVISNAAILIIGDEVLNGKTKDSNSNFAAKLFFDCGVELKRIEVIADDEEEIIEAVLRMSKKYDIVITSGGIGPTHDDITYDSIAAAYKVDKQYDDETIRRMTALSKKRYNLGEQTEEQKTARLRMALFPVGAEVLFVKEELWVPVVRVAGKICILPGVPTVSLQTSTSLGVLTDQAGLLQLFQQLLTGLCARFVKLPPSSSKPFRLLIHTESVFSWARNYLSKLLNPAYHLQSNDRLPESSIAPFLTKLQEKVKTEQIRVGSYPKLLAGVDVSLIGKDLDRLKELSQEVIQELQGTLVLEGKLGEEQAKQ
ncbi:hypothetical protein P7C70_g372, partial [Phenoliferia sp. Uapishka_3]